jgi:hypothetical protein
MTAFAFGAIVSYPIDRMHLASWTWTVGLIWLLLGIRELTHEWSPSWSHAKSSLDYARSQLFPSNNSCSDSECLYYFFYAVPFVASAGYSVGGFARKHFGHEKPAHD